MIFIFPPNFAKNKFEDLKYDNSIFKLQQKILKYEIFFENSKVFSF